MSDSPNTIDTDLLDNVTGGAVLGAAASTTARRTSSSSNQTLQTALTGVTSALDSLKQNQNKNPIEQLLPVALVAKWIQNR